MDNQEIDLNALAAASRAGWEKAPSRSSAPSPKHPHFLDIVALSSLPEFAPENNPDLPFAITVILRLGTHGRFIRPLGDPDLELGSETLSLWKRLTKVLGKTHPGCFYKSAEISIASGEFPLALQVAEDENKFHLKVLPGEASKRSIGVEVWEKGTLIRRSNCARETNRSLVDFSPGVSLFVRAEDSKEAVEILLYEIEFTPEDWKAAIVACCLSGRIPEAIRILREELGPGGMGQGFHRWLDVGLEAVEALTKSVGPVLQPVPAVRSTGGRIDSVVTALAPVWHGLVQCWPAVQNLENLWDEEAAGNVRASQEGELDASVASLANLCIDLAVGRESEISELKEEETDRRLNNAWAALQGWWRLNQKQFEEAEQAFSAVDPIEDDPFSVALGKRLSEHLHSCSKNQRDSISALESSDKIWEHLFGFA